MGHETVFIIWGKGGISVLGYADGVRIHSSHKTRTAGGTDRALAKSVSEGDCTIHQPVQVWRVDVRIVQSMDGIKPLLVGTVPEDIRQMFHCLLSAQFYECDNVMWLQAINNAFFVGLPRLYPANTTNSPDTNRILPYFASLI